MNFNFQRKKVFVYIIALSILTSCVDLKKVTQTLTNLKRLEFKLQDIDNFRLNNINISNKKSISDFSITDGMKLVQIFNSNKLPTEFILNIAAKNPNDGKGGSRKTTSTISGLDWNLYIDNKLTVSGDMNKSIDIPGTGESTVIPLKIKLDLYEFFGDKGYNDVINLALALGGVSGNTSRLKLDIKPTVSTSIGQITYPGRITVIDKEFRGN
ncbi:hypothetical protein ACFLSQ_06315 [Bacteroidota bacterium]